MDLVFFLQSHNYSFRISHLATGTPQAHSTKIQKLDTYTVQPRFENMTISNSMILYTPAQYLFFTRSTKSMIFLNSYATNVNVCKQESGTRPGHQSSFLFSLKLKRDWLR